MMNEHLNDADRRPEFWWRDHPEQKFWMEIAGAKPPGIDLRAPIANPAERKKWHWDLVRHVRPGDVILHWFTTSARAKGIVGWSRAASTPVVRDHVWVPRTRPDIDESTAQARPHWVVPLEGYTRLARPITRQQIEVIHQDVIKLAEHLRLLYPQFQYYPFQDYRPDEIRANQAYLTKMPIELLRLLNRTAPLGFEVDYEAYRADSL